MRQFGLLLWKEWRESQAYLWIGLGVFLGLPLIGGMEDVLTSARHFHVDAVPWVVCFGGVLAIFTAVGATCRDLSTRVEEFWRSVPVTVSRWLSIKFIVGAVIVLLACAVPIIFQAKLAHDGDLLNRLCWFSLLVFAVYGLAFASGCLLRRTAHAAMVALSLMLLVCLLPVILPPLAFMNVLDFDDLTKEPTGGTRVDFIAVMLGLAGVSDALAIIAVRRSWRIESRRKLIYGAVAAVVLILAASASYELGTNLRVLQTLQIPGARMAGWTPNSVEEIRVDGNSGAVVTAQYHSQDSNWQITKFVIGPDGIKLGAAETPKEYWPLWVSHMRDTISTKGVEYDVSTETDSRVGPLRLTGLQRNANGQEPAKHTFDVKLWDLDQHGNDAAYQYVWNDRLYILGIDQSLHRDSQGNLRPEWMPRANRLAILDVSDPLRPRVLSIAPMDYRFAGLPGVSNWSQGKGPIPDQMTVALPSIPGLPAQKRLNIALLWRWYLKADDTFIFEWDRGMLAAFHVDLSSEKEARFAQIGVYKPSALERFFGGHFSWYPRQNDAPIHDGFLYLAEEFHNNLLQPCICVFDLRGEHPMKLVAHFAAPGAWVVCPLDDGRALIGGSKLWLVGPPPRR